MRSTLSIFTLLIGLASCASPVGAASEKMIVEFSAQPETRAEFIDELNLILVDTRAFEGCLGVTVWTNESDAGKVYLLEEWASRDNQVAYLNWRTETNNTAHLGRFMSGQPRFLWLNEH
jgi:quinol monooxygenase YgiN